MPRRASSGINPTLIIGVVVVAIVAFFGGKALLSKKAKSFDGSPTLSMDDYKEHGNGLRGNEYVVEGTVDEQRVNDMGRVVFIRVKGSSGDDYLGVKIPSDLSVKNIEREQRYSFKVKIEKQGIPVAVAVTPL